MSTHQEVVNVNGTRLYYEMAGAGPPLVLIHGNALDVRMRDDQQVRAAAMTSGIAAARQCWLAGALFATALEHPQVAARFTQMVTDYSGWHWFNQETLRLLDPLPIQQLDTTPSPVSSSLASETCPIST